MKQLIRAKFHEMFHQHSGYARTKDILYRGIHTIYPKELEGEGTILNINHNYSRLRAYCHN